MIAVLLTSALATAATPAAPARVNPPAVRTAVLTADPAPMPRPPVRLEPMRDDKKEP